MSKLCLHVFLGTPSYQGTFMDCNFVEVFDSLLYMFFYLVVSFCFVFESCVINPRYQCTLEKHECEQFFLSRDGRQSLNLLDIVSIYVLQLIFCSVLCSSEASIIVFDWKKLYIRCSFFFLHRIFKIINMFVLCNFTG